MTSSGSASWPSEASPNDGRVSRAAGGLEERVRSVSDNGARDDDVTRSSEDPRQLG